MLLSGEFGSGNALPVLISPMLACLLIGPFSLVVLCMCDVVENVAAKGRQLLEELRSTSYLLGCCHLTLCVLCQNSRKADDVSEKDLSL